MAKKKPTPEYVDQNVDLDTLEKERFELVKERDEKIYDKKFESKPIGYFKDAMIRFSKNKTNLIASIILGILILLAVFVPMLTTKNISRLESQLAHLPPRVPIIENLGFLDGRSKIVEQTVDQSTIGTIEGYEHLGYPSTYNPEFIVLETLENIEQPCSSRTSEACVGGQVQMTLLSGGQEGLYRGNESFVINPSEDYSYTIDVESIDANATLIIYLVDSSDDFFTIGEIDSAGSYDFDPMDTLTITSNESYRLHIGLNSSDTNAKALLNSVSLDNLTDNETLFDHSGYFLASYNVVDNTVQINRVSATTVVASFDFEAYERAFGVRNRRQFTPADLYDLLDENQDVCGSNLPRNLDPGPVNIEFDEGCPVIRVNSRSEVDTIGGRDYYTYNVDLNYALINGYDSVPYFFFGTTNSGTDLFAVTWLGLRTSLLIGLTVAIINITIGIVYGSISGYYGGKVDLIMERFSEIIGRIPWLVLLSIFYALIGPGALTLILILVVSGWIGVASVTRTQFYRYKGREYVLASRTLGAKDSRLIFRHILPNGIGTIITASILMIPTVIFTEAALSYLGFGIGHGQSFKLFGLIDLSGVSIGVLLADGQNEMMEKPYLTIFPAIVISILMITFNMFGNALRDAFNPSLRGSE